MRFAGAFVIQTARDPRRYMGSRWMWRKSNIVVILSRDIYCSASWFMRRGRLVRSRFAVKDTCMP